MNREQLTAPESDHRQNEDLQPHPLPGPSRQADIGGPSGELDGQLLHLVIADEYGKYVHVGDAHLLAVTSEELEQMELDEDWTPWPRGTALTSLLPEVVPNFESFELFGEQ